MQFVAQQAVTHSSDHFTSVKKVFLLLLEFLFGHFHCFQCVLVSRADLRFGRSVFKIMQTVISEVGGYSFFMGNIHKFFISGNKVGAVSVIKIICRNFVCSDMLNTIHLYPSFIVFCFALSVQHFGKGLKTMRITITQLADKAIVSVAQAFNG